MQMTNFKSSDVFLITEHLFTTVMAWPFQDSQRPF